MRRETALMFVFAVASCGALVVQVLDRIPDRVRSDVRRAFQRALALVLALVGIACGNSAGPRPTAPYVVTMQIHPAVDPNTGLPVAGTCHFGGWFQAGGATAAQFDTVLATGQVAADTFALAADVRYAFTTVVGRTTLTQDAVAPGRLDLVCYL